MYKVIPFQSYISYQGNAQQVSGELQNIINTEAANGWMFIQIQELTTFKAGTAGCFGFGAAPDRQLAMAVLGFRHV
ncbi:MAG: hypothetical protein SGI92_34020 [Bryobacteraceae bacterium]|nr:hypothetical protein [Bryobacteraceae bacterium]